MSTETIPMIVYKFDDEYYCDPFTGELRLAEEVARLNCTIVTKGEATDIVSMHLYPQLHVEA